MHRLRENFELMPLGPGTIQQIGGRRLAGEERNILQSGSIPRILIAASMPFMSVMITSEISMSGFSVFAVSTAFSPL